jgi:D-lactate dehydrogenase (cytochrome)
MGVPVARIELLDDAAPVRAVNAYSRLTLPETPLLLLEFHGSTASVAEQARPSATSPRTTGGTGFAWTTSPEERTRLWQARHDAYWAMLALRPGAKALATDVCVPISRLAESVEAARTKADELGLLAPILGHVGDGNFHVTPLIDLADPAEVAAVEGLSPLARRACHRDGRHLHRRTRHRPGKAGLSSQGTGEAVDVMVAIKTTLDPLGIMNPGKVL